MAVPGHRAERLADLIRAEVAKIIAGELKDPRVGFATVTAVDLSADLHHARVAVSVLGAADAQQKSLEGLTSATGYVRRELGIRLRLRRTPELTFVLDQGTAENAAARDVATETERRALTESSVVSRPLAEAKVEDRGRRQILFCLNWQLKTDN